jgi:hypothetical protein
MTGSQWLGCFATYAGALQEIGGRVFRGIIGGFIGVVLAGLMAALLSSYSDGALIHMLGGVTSAELVAEAAKHPGPPGPAGQVATVPTVSLVLLSSNDFDKSAPIPNSETASICMLSKIVLRRYVSRPDRSCELTPGAQRSEPWRITADGAVCGVTCFGLAATQ